MTAIKISDFSGVSPRTPARYLQPQQAQTALNCPAWFGSLTSLRDMATDSGSYLIDNYDYFLTDYMEDGAGATLLGVDAKTIYLFGRTLDNYQWLHWDSYVDVVRGLIAGDTDERTFFTGDGVPKYTLASLNTETSPYPNQDRALGLPVPTSAPSCSATGTPSANAITETRAYTYTWVSKENDVGDESAPYSADPYPSGAQVDVDTGETVDVTLPVPYEDTGTHDGSSGAATLSDSGATWTTNEWVGYVVKNITDGSWGYVTANTGTTVTATLAHGSENDWDAGDTYEIVTYKLMAVTHKRIYRSVVGLSGIVQFLYVGETDYADGSWNDAVLAKDLGEVCETLTWTPPPDDLGGLVGLPGGMLAGFSGRDIYISDPYHPYAFPEEYVHTTRGLPVGLGVADTTLVVLTDGRPVFIQGSHPSNMVVVEADIHQACVSKRSIVSMMGGVFYATPDGLMMVSTRGSKLITQDFMSRDQWKELYPESIHAYQHEDRYVAFFDSPTLGQGGFVFDPVRQILVFHDRYGECGYNSLEDDALFISSSNVIYQWDAGGLLNYTWRSKKFTLERETGFSAARVEFDRPNSTCSVTMRVYCDDTKIFEQTMESFGVERLPPITGRTWEIELEGNCSVFLAGIAESPQEFGVGGR